MVKTPNKFITLAEMHQILQIPLVQSELGEFIIQGLAPLYKAEAGDLCFARQEKSLAQLTAGVICLVDFSVSQEYHEIILIQVPCVEEALTQILQFWEPWFYDLRLSELRVESWIHPTAVVEGEVGEGVCIGPFSYVAKGSYVGDGTVISSHVAILPRVYIGKDCVIQSQVVLGEDGFGFGADPKNPGTRLPHFGGVYVGDRVHLGSQTQVSAGRFFPTQIGDDSKIDALVQIGHNCILGQRCFMAGQSGLAGSVELEDDVKVGGGASIAGHLVVGRSSMISGRAVLLKSIPANSHFSGFPARSHYQWLRGLSAKN